jgi:hypothetical protein
MPQRGYINLQLSFSSMQGKEYSVKLHSDAGDVKGQFLLPFSAEELQDSKHEIEKAVLRQGKTRLAQPTEMDLIRDFGTRLFQAFSSNVINRYHATLDIAEQKPQCDGVRICLVFDDPRLATLPWEFLFDTQRREFVGLSSRSPIVRYVELPRPARVLSVDLPLRVTVVIANPKGTVPITDPDTDF